MSHVDISNCCSLVLSEFSCGKFNVWCPQIFTCQTLAPAQLRRWRKQENKKLEKEINPPGEAGTAGRKSSQRRGSKKGSSAIGSDGMAHVTADSSSNLRSSSIEAPSLSALAGSESKASPEMGLGLGRSVPIGRCVFYRHNRRVLSPRLCCVIHC